MFRVGRTIFGRVGHKMVTGSSQQAGTREAAFPIFGTGDIPGASACSRITLPTPPGRLRQGVNMPMFVPT